MVIKQKIFMGIVILYAVFAFVRILFPDLDHGDEFTDANVLNAGMNFVNHGFSRTCFLPCFDVQKSTPVTVYLTCPPGPEIFNGFLRKCFNINSLYGFRIVSLLISFLGLIFWYLFVKKVTNSSGIALLASFFYICHPFFLFGFDSLHELSLSEVFRFGFLYLAAIFVKTENRQHKNLALAFMCVCFFLVSSVTYEYTVYLALFLILFWRWHSRKVFCKEIYLLLAIPVASFLLHFAQDVCYLGGVMKALDFMKATLVRRVLNSPDAPGKLNFLTWCGMLSHYFFQALIFPLLMSIVLVFSSIIFYYNSDHQTKDKVRKALKLLFLLLICGLTWYVLFPAHSHAHMYVGFLVRLIVPFAVIGLAIFAYLSWKMAVKSRTRLCLLLWCFVVFLLGWESVQNSGLPLNPRKIYQSRSFLKFKNCLTVLKNKSRESDIVGVNYFRFPFIRYYTDREVLSIFTDVELIGMAKLPEYFIFMPYGEQSSMRLLEALKTRYDVFLQCDSEIFPALIWKVKEDQGRRN
jgi:hypothetical protein